MNAVTFREYRLTSQEASKYDARGIVEQVVWRLMEQEPDDGDAESMENFFGHILHVQAAAYSVWQVANWVVVGGLGHAFEMCCAPVIYTAIDGFDLMHEPKLADRLRQVCRMFPGGSVPRDREEAEAFIHSQPEDGEMDELFDDFEGRPVKEWFDFERFLKSHRDCFVIPSEGAVQQARCSKPGDNALASLSASPARDH